MVKENHKKNNTGKWIWTAAIVLANLILWAVPSDLAYNVAEQRDILLGRYTVDHTTTIIVVLVISVLVINGIRSNQKRTAKEEREHKFKVIALSVSIVVSITAADVFLRVVRSRQYVKNENLYYRLINTVQHGINRDVPPTAFSYPNATAGYPELEYTLTTDGRGFRNKTDFETYDIVVLGDSFAEGSHVSDDQAWPVLLAEKSNCTVYNLGMSSGNPVTYVETLKRFGLDLSPKTVICMLYEGNDLRSANFEHNNNPKPAWGLKTLFRTSPLRYSAKQALIRCLGPINSNRFSVPAAASNEAQGYSRSHPLYAVSWLPLAIPDGPEAKCYTFKVKRLLAHFEGKETFPNSKGYRQTLVHLREIRRICAENGIRLLVVYAPDKPHALMPLVIDRVSPDKLRAFMALRQKNLPGAEELVDVLRERLAVQESAVEAFCKDEGIEFVSLTGPLRKKITQGLQAYYTYDQHWTPVGHEIAAETLRRYMQDNPAESRGVAPEAK